MNAGESHNAAAVRRELVQLVRTHGVELLDDSRRVRAMLADAVAGASAEANLIGLALSSGVPGRLRDASRDPARAGAAVADTAAHLERTSSVQPSDAQWAVLAVAEAMGITGVGSTQGSPATAAPGGRPAGSPAGTPGPNDLLVRLGHREHTATPGSTVTLGRDPSCTLTTESSAVSRQHGRIQHGSAGWEYVDLDSTQGSFVGGARVRTHPVRGETVVTLGQGPDAVTLQLVPFGRAETVLPAGTGAAAAPATQLPSRPGGALAGAPAARTELGGSAAPAAVTATLGGTTRQASAGQTLSVGRETDNDLVATGTTVSRHHVRIEQRDDAWRLRDLGSTSGTWLDGQRVTDVPLSGRQTFVLGDSATGDRLTTEAPVASGTSGTAATPKREKSGRRWGPGVAAAAAVAAIALIAGGIVGWQSLRDDEDTTPTASSKEDRLDRLAKGTVLLKWSDARSSTFGSGTVIDKERGLILTNAHVAAPAAVGSAIRDGYVFFSPAVKNPTDIEVFVSEGVGKPAQPRFTAQVVAVDGYLDLAVLEIKRTTVGSFPEPEDLAALTEIPVGDSDDLEPTDELSVLGYPGAQESLGPTYGPAVVSGWTGDDRLGTNKAYINSTDVVAHGNSGGLAADEEGNLVGVPSLLRADNLARPGSQPDYTTVGSAIRPVNFAKPLIEAATEGEKYVSPYAVAKPRGARILGVQPNVFVEPADPGSITANCNYDTGEYPNWAFGVRYKGFSGGAHTDIVAIFTDPDTNAVLDYSVTRWETSMPRSGCMTITTNLTTLPDRVAMTIAVGGDVVPIWRGVLR